MGRYMSLETLSNEISKNCNENVNINGINSYSDKKSRNIVVQLLVLSRINPLTPDSFIYLKRNRIFLIIFQHEEPFRSGIFLYQLVKLVYWLWRKKINVFLKKKNLHVSYSIQSISLYILHTTCKCQIRRFRQQRLIIALVCAAPSLLSLSSNNLKILHQELVLVALRNLILLPMLKWIKVKQNTFMTCVVPCVRLSIMFILTAFTHCRLFMTVLQVSLGSR